MKEDITIIQTRLEAAILAASNVKKWLEKQAITGLIREIDGVQDTLLLTEKFIEQVREEQTQQKAVA